MAEGWRLRGFTFMTGRVVSRLVFPECVLFLDRFDLITSWSYAEMGFVCIVFVFVDNWFFRTRYISWALWSINGKYDGNPGFEKYIVAGHYIHGP